MEKFVNKTVLSKKDINEFKGKNFVFLGTAPSSSKGQVFVNTEVPMDQGAPAKVLWRVREKNNNYKIVDIVIEGVARGLHLLEHLIPCAMHLAVERRIYHIVLVLCVVVKSPRSLLAV